MRSAPRWAPAQCLRRPSFPSPTSPQYSAVLGSTKTVLNEYWTEYSTEAVDFSFCPTRRLAATWAIRAPFNLRLERAPTLNIWGSDTCMSYSPDRPYGRTCHRCTCHPHEQPWGETQGLKHNRGIELCLSFLKPLWVELYARLLCVEGFLRAFAPGVGGSRPSLSCSRMFMQSFLAFSVPQFGERLLDRSA